MAGPKNVGGKKKIAPVIIKKIQPLSNEQRGMIKTWNTDAKKLPVPEEALKLIISIQASFQLGENPKDKIKKLEQLLAGAGAQDKFVSKKSKGANQACENFKPGNELKTPNFGYIPKGEVGKKPGRLKSVEADYVEWLFKNIYKGWEAEPAKIPEINGDKSLDLIRYATNALVRCRGGELETIVEWGVLTKQMANAIGGLNVFKDISVISRMLKWFAAEYVVFGNGTLKQIETAVKKLKPYGYVKYLYNKYAAEGVTKSDVWFFVTTYTEPEEKIKAAIQKAGELYTKYKPQGLTESDVWFFVKKYTDPEEKIKAAIQKVGELYTKYKPQGVTESDAWYFVKVFTEPEEKIKAAIQKAEELYTKYKPQGLTESDVWFFVKGFTEPEEKIKAAIQKVEELYTKYKPQGLTESDVWVFVKEYTDPETALKSSLKKGKPVFTPPKGSLCIIDYKSMVALDYLETAAKETFKKYKPVMKLGYHATKNAARGGLNFFIGDVISDLIVNGGGESKKTLSSPEKVAKNYGYLTLGGQIGSWTTKGLFSIPKIKHAPNVVKKIAGRGIPLFTALTALEVGENGEVDWSNMPMNMAKIGVASLMVGGMEVMLTASKTGSKAMKVLRLANQAGKVTCWLWAIVSVVAEFTIIELLSKLEAHLVEKDRLDIMTQEISKAMVADQKVLAKLALGKKVTKKDLKKVENHLMACDQVIKVQMQIPEQLIKAEHEKNYAKLHTEYVSEWTAGLNGSTSRAEVDAKYEPKFAELKNEKKEALKELQEKKANKVAVAPKEIPGNPLKSLTGNLDYYFLPDESDEPVDMDGEIFEQPPVWKGYEYMVSEGDWEGLLTHLHKYIDKRNEFMKEFFFANMYASKDASNMSKPSFEIEEGSLYELIQQQEK